MNSENHNGDTVKDHNGVVQEEPRKVDAALIWSLPSKVDPGSDEPDEAERFATLPQMPSRLPKRSDGASPHLGKVRTLLLALDEHGVLRTQSTTSGKAPPKHTKVKAVANLTPKMVDKVNENLRLQILHEVRLGSITIDDAMSAITTGRLTPTLQHLHAKSPEGDDNPSLTSPPPQRKAPNLMYLNRLENAQCAMARSGQWCEADAKFENSSLVLTRNDGNSVSFDTTGEVNFKLIENVPLDGYCSIEIVKGTNVVGYFCADTKSETETWLSLLCQPAPTPATLPTMQLERKPEDENNTTALEAIHEPEEQLHAQEPPASTPTPTPPTVTRPTTTSTSPTTDSNETRAVSESEVSTTTVAEASPLTASNDLPHNNDNNQQDEPDKEDDFDEKPPTPAPRTKVNVDNVDELMRESPTSLEELLNLASLESRSNTMVSLKNSTMLRNTSAPHLVDRTERRTLKNRPTLLGVRNTSTMKRNSQAVVPEVDGVRDCTSRSIGEIVDEEDTSAMHVSDVCDDRVGDMQTSEYSVSCAYLKTEMDNLHATMVDRNVDGTNAGYSAAYQNMKNVGTDQPALASRRPNNKLKNRYGNIVAYDNSRVVLDVINDDPDTDYVNANWISGYNKPREYIASQGPVPNSFISFWRMIWYCNIETIVMVTHEVEKGRMKCHRYWPDPTSNPPSKEMEYGSVRVVHVMTQEHDHFYSRTFDVIYNGEKRTVKQFAYLSWPDHGVPMTSPEILGFRNAVRSSRQNLEAPMLVHCSAGVGRTGTYIAIDRLLEQCVHMESNLDVDKILRDMRMARNFMIQTEIQYVFVYRAVYDAICELYAEETEKAQDQAHLEQSRLEQEATALAAQKASEIAHRIAQDEMKAIEEARAAYEAEMEAQRVAVQNARKNEEDLVSMATTEHTANAAKAIIRTTIAERMKLLNHAGTTWLEDYRTSLNEWNTRNEFDAEDYDVASSLTPIQSRLAALKEHCSMTAE
eukprot:m.92899 g.92899  ORF g.92899 m.92899 type:complete len:978 (-) comp26581_c0_seq2:163-3096(-)